MNGPGDGPQLGFVIPTKDRPGHLRRMLASLKAQSAHPAQLVIVDGGETPVEDVMGEFGGLNILYRRVYPPSLARQRNAGMEMMAPTITHAGYLDDDLLFEPGSMAAMMAWWSAAPPDAGGAAFNIVNQRLPRGLWLKSLFLIDSYQRGVVLRSGFNTPIGSVASSRWVEWLYGGATVWRREVINRIQYDEWFEGLGFLEDLDYSFHVGRTYRLAVVAEARIQHHTAPEVVGRHRNFLLGKWQAINRMYVVRKYPEFSVPACLWALSGQILVNSLKTVAERNTNGLWRAAGNCVGLAMLAGGRIERIGGTFKAR